MGFRLGHRRPGATGIAVALTAVLALAGCAPKSTSKTILTDYERRISVDEGIEREFHSVLYYPKGIALHWPGYVVGVEKAPTKLLEAVNPQVIRTQVDYFDKEPPPRNTPG